jgi:hypothetical protein
VRSGGGKRYLFLLNFTPDPVEIPVPAAWSAELDAKIGGGKVCLGGYDATVLSSATL